MIGQTALLEALANEIADAFAAKFVYVLLDRLAEHDRRLQAEERYAWLSLRTVAKLLDCGPEFAREQLAGQGIAPVKFGAEVRYPAAAVYEWLGPREEEARQKKDRRYPRGVVLFGGARDDRGTQKRARQRS